MPAGGYNWGPHPAMREAGNAFVIEKAERETCFAAGC